jgi:hypothetical protein
MLSDLQCWHLCQCCLRDHFHFIASPEAPLDPWLRQCDECVASGKVPEITKRESDVPEGIESQVPAEVIPEAAPNHEEVWPEPMGSESSPWSPSHEDGKMLDDLRILYDRELIHETF